MIEANTLSTRIDQDKLSLISRDQVAYDAHLMLDSLRNLKGERQVAAIATLFAVVIERYSGSPQDLYSFGRKILGADEPFHDKANVQLEALRDFAALNMHSSPRI